jgi:hypothetical protein
MRNNASQRPTDKGDQGSTRVRRIVGYYTSLGLTKGL